MDRQLQIAVNDIAYSAGQTLGSLLDTKQIGNQQWRNEVYLAMEGDIPRILEELMLECADQFQLEIQELA